jgi:hypothetical protein
MSSPASLTSQNIEALQDRLEALIRCNPETGEQWADICAIEAVIVEWQSDWDDGLIEGSPQWEIDNGQFGVGA